MSRTNDRRISFPNGWSKVKKKGAREYQNIHRQIENKTREAKQNELNENCNEIAALQKKCNRFNRHKKIKETTGVHKTTTALRLVDTAKYYHWQPRKNES